MAIEWRNPRHDRKPELHRWHAYWPREMVKLHADDPAEPMSFCGHWAVDDQDDGVVLPAPPKGARFCLACQRVIARMEKWTAFWREADRRERERLAEIQADESTRHDRFRRQALARASRFQASQKTPEEGAA